MRRLLAWWQRRSRVGQSVVVVAVSAVAVVAAVGVATLAGRGHDATGDGTDGSASSATATPEDRCYQYALALVRKSAEAMNEGYPGGIDAGEAITSDLGISSTDLQESRVMGAFANAQHYLEQFVSQGAHPLAVIDRVEPYVRRECYDQNGTWTNVPDQGLIGLR